MLNIYEYIFFWIGVASSALYIFLGVAVFAYWVLEMVYRRFQNGKRFADIMIAWRAHGKVDNPSD